MSESEGELKKRIKDWERYWEELYGDLDLAIRRSEQITLEKIVDEALKEFPLGTDPKYKDKMFSERNILLSGARLRWFVRWFVEGNQEK